MATRDNTDSFRQIVQGHSRVPSRRKRSRKEHSTSIVTREFTAEALRILNLICVLSDVLASVRRPYLDRDSARGPLASTVTLQDLDLLSSLHSWDGLQYLSDDQRDQIDVQSRDIIAKCSMRIQELETLNRRSQELGSPHAGFARLLPARLRGDTNAREIEAAHQAGITWYLNRRLALVGGVQKAMQEQRLARQLETTKTLRSTAASEAAEIQNRIRPHFAYDPQGDPHSESRRATSSTISVQRKQSPTSGDGDDMAIEYGEIPAEQIKLFEDENQSLILSMQSDLHAVQQAESRLLAISTLQSELVQHLTRQTELTDQLYDDAVNTSETAMRGNVQLKEARRRSKDSRLYILVFLVGASCALLFLHFY